MDTIKEDYPRPAYMTKINKSKKQSMNSVKTKDFHYTAESIKK